MISPTNQNLEQLGHGPLMRYLIAAALDGSTMTYGEAKSRLEKEVDFSTIFTTKMGYVVGTMVDRLLEVDPRAPLLNVLLVSQQDRMPSEGAAGYMADRFQIPKLRQESARTRFPQLWRDAFDEAAAEVYAYTEEEWAALYEKVFSTPLSPPDIDAVRAGRREGSERDGRNGGGEGPNHLALRLWTKANSGAVSIDYHGCRAETEVCLDSGDRVDAVYYCEDRIVVLEVKSRDSNIADLRRGVFQCIKYRAVQEAMDVRPDVLVEPVLVTEMPLPGEIRDLLKLHEIIHFQASLDRE